jgi:hypothetical protein
MNEQKLFSFGCIPNHPEMSIKIFTQPIAQPSISIRVKAFRGFERTSLVVGVPMAKKSA